MQLQERAALIAQLQGQLVARPRQEAILQLSAAQVPATTLCASSWRTWLVQACGRAHAPSTCDIVSSVRHVHNAYFIDAIDALQLKL